MALTSGLALPCALPACIGARRQAPSARAGSPVAACKRSASLLQRDAGLAALQRQCALQSAPSRRYAARQQPCRASAAAAAEGQGFSSEGLPPQPAASGEAKKSMKETLTLGALFGGWYLFNIWFNIYNKQALKVFPYPVTCTAIQFGVGSLLALTMWTLGLHKKPDLSDGVVKKISPLAAVHTLGNALTNISLGRVAVSFTHTIKAMEPFFSVLLSSLFLGEKASLPVLATLLPIVGGVAAASVSEVTFNWGGFAAAMGSNLTFQSRNVLSKKFMGDVKGNGGLDNINLFSIITILSFFILAPIALLTDGVRFTPAALRASGIADVGLLTKHVLLAAFCFHMYQQVSYMILQRVSPVTHSIGNCLKRVIVIIASVIVFQNPMSRQNMIGTGVALFGVFSYSQVKRLTGKKKAA